MADKCIWKPEINSDRRWYSAVDHINEDPVEPVYMRLWSYCPHCGREIEVLMFFDASQAQRPGVANE